MDQSAGWKPRIGVHILVTFTHLLTADGRLSTVTVVLGHGWGDVERREKPSHSAIANQQSAFSKSSTGKREKSTKTL